MDWFMLAMISHPEKQKKCQAELDAVVGRSRVPTFQDLENLTYIQATVREILRWRSAFPLGELPWL
jgi:cytochrome P450